MNLPPYFSPQVFDLHKNLHFAKHNNNHLQPNFKQQTHCVEGQHNKIVLGMDAMVRVLPFCFCLVAVGQAKLLRKRRESPLDVIGLSKQFILKDRGRSPSSHDIVEDELIEDFLARYLQTDGAFSISMSMSMPAASPTPSSPVTPTQPPAVPTDEPATSAPTVAPVDGTTSSPTVAPIDVTTSSPTESPVNVRTSTPTTSPVDVESSSPTAAPADVGSSSPTESPVDAVTPSPTQVPIESPNPSIDPTDAPMEGTTAAPTADEPSPAPTTSDERDQEVLNKCDVTALERSRDILTILSQISDGASLITLGTPEFEARQWLDNEDDAIICADNEERIEQRYRVAVLYFALGGPEWINCRASKDAIVEVDWCLIDDVRQNEDENSLPIDARQPDFPEEEAIRFLSEANECEWFGLGCTTYDPEATEVDPYFPLTSIDLPLNGLNGYLPSEIFGLMELQRLSMYDNLIYGTIPEELGNLGDLRKLSLDENAITGSIPEGLYELNLLGAVDLHANLLQGTISPAIDNLVDLLVLQLEFNQLTGPIPTDSLLELTKLDALTIQENMLTGTLEPLCEVRDEVLIDDEMDMYLRFMFADCAGDPPEVICSCCTCF